MIKQYDVVVYKNGSQQIVHRIIDIVDTDEGAKYILRGDSNNANDAVRVSYEQIIGIYSNKRIPAAGMFVLFLQSPLGYIAMGLVMLMEFIAPFFEKRINDAIDCRLKAIGVTKDVIKSE